MAPPGKFRIEYTPQQRKNLQARCAFCRRHFKQNKLRIGTMTHTGDYQWRHTNRKCRAWQYILARVQGPEDFDGWAHVKALDKKRVRKFFVAKTKARIMKKETTVPKVPEDPNAQEENDIIMEEKDGAEDDSEDDEDQSSDNDDSGDDDAPSKEIRKVNKKAPMTASAPNHAETDLERKHQDILDTRMKEIKGVFDNGINKSSLIKARVIATDIMAMTTALLNRMSEVEGE